MSIELLQRGIIVSSSGIRSIWLRNDLETFKKRLKALEAKSAQDGLVLTESQLLALEKSKLEKEAHGEIETECPGYLGAQDTYFVGTIKGIGRIYQQTFKDSKHIANEKNISNILREEQTDLTYLTQTVRFRVKRQIKYEVLQIKLQSCPTMNYV